jgi:hypothetical protein
MAVRNFGFKLRTSARVRCGDMDGWVLVLTHPCVGDPKPAEDDEWPRHFERHDSAVLPHSNGDGCPRSLGK